jgi:hypothetical protein
VDAAAWAPFRDKAIAAPAKLDNILIRLSNPQLKSPDCNGVFPPLDPKANDFFKCRIGELSFAPRRNWGQNGNECYIRGNYLVGGPIRIPQPLDR